MPSSSSTTRPTPSPSTRRPRRSGWGRARCGRDAPSTTSTREAMTPWEWYGPLQEVADESGLLLFSTPFDRTAVDFLIEQGTPAFKVASFELVDLELIATVASHGLPLIMSTGMATVDEIDEAVRTATEAGATEIALLRCNSSYPAPVEEMDLATIADMRGTVAGGRRVVRPHARPHRRGRVGGARGTHHREARDARPGRRRTRRRLLPRAPRAPPPRRAGARDGRIARCTCATGRASPRRPASPSAVPSSRSPTSRRATPSIGPTSG